MVIFEGGPADGQCEAVDLQVGGELPARRRVGGVHVYELMGSADGGGWDQGTFVYAPAV